MNAMFKRKKASASSMAIIGLGRVVRRLGRLVGGKVGAGIVGFGLAHVFLGSLAKFRSQLRFR